MISCWLFALYTLWLTLWKPNLVRFRPQINFGALLVSHWRWIDSCCHFSVFGGQYVADRSTWRFCLTLCDFQEANWCCYSSSVLAYGQRLLFSWWKSPVLAQKMYPTLVRWLVCQQIWYFSIVYHSWLAGRYSYYWQHPDINDALCLGLRT